MRGLVPHRCHHHSRRTLCHPCGLVHQMLCLRQVLPRRRTHFRHPLYCHVAPELQCTPRTGMFRLTKCQTNLTRIVYPPLYSGEVTKNVGISSRRFYIPQPRARFSLTKRPPLHTATRHAPHANDTRQPFPVTKSMRIWRTEIRQINQKKPFCPPFYTVYRPLFRRTEDRFRPTSGQLHFFLRQNFFRFQPNEIPISGD